MSLNRRRFLGSTAALGILPAIAREAAAQAVAPRPRMALEKFSADQNQVALLRKAVGAMKARRPSDPTSWFFQSAIHGVPDDWIAKAAKIDPQIAKVDQKKYWNRCPHHAPYASADFPLWHRAYIYHFEKILRAASGDPAFSLPYWNYVAPRAGGIAPNRSMPEIFRDNVTGDGKVNPLFDGRREYAFVSGLYDLSDEAVAPDIAYASQTYFAKVGTSAFGGATNDVEPDGHGLLEAHPHNNVHLAIGGLISSDQGDSAPDDAQTGIMADTATAAYDPLFWVHHATVDLIWLRWSSMPNKSFGDAPQGWWDARPFAFVEPDGKDANHSRRDYADLRTLGVSYDVEPQSKPISPPPRVLLAGSAPGAGGGGAQQLAAPPLQRSMPPGPSAEPPQRITLGSSGALTLSPTSHTSVTIPVAAPALLRATVPAAGGAARPAGGSPDLRGGAAQLPQARPPQPPALPARLLVEISGVRYAGTPLVGYDVYLGKDPSGRFSRSSANFVGSLGLFGHKSDAGHTMATGSTGQLFEVDSSASHDPAALEVTIVPYPLLVPRDGTQPQLKGNADVKIDAVRVHAAP